MEEKRWINKDKLLVSLETMLCWLHSPDCREEMFDEVTEYGKVYYSLDDLVTEAMYYINKERR